MRSYEDSLQRLGLAGSTSWRSTTSTSRTTARARRSTSTSDELTAGGGWRALESLKAAGEIKAIGCGVNSLGAILEVLDRGMVDFFLLALPYTLADQGALDEDLPRCAERGVDGRDRRVFASGILATGPTPNSRYAYGPAPEAMKAKVGRIEAVCRRHGVPLPAAALQFPLAHPLVAAIIPGAHNVEVLQQNLAGFRHADPAAPLGRAQAEGLLRRRRADPRSFATIPDRRAAGEP